MGFALLSKLFLRANRTLLLMARSHGVLFHMDNHLILQDYVRLVFLELPLTEALR